MSATGEDEWQQRWAPLCERGYRLRRGAEPGVGTGKAKGNREGLRRARAKYQPCDACGAFVSVRHACRSARGRARRKGEDESRARLMVGDGCFRCSGLFKRNRSRFVCTQRGIIGRVQSGDVRLSYPLLCVGDVMECVMGEASVRRAVARVENSLG